MARGAKKLSAVAVKNLSKPGRHADGDGLYLKIAPGGSKSWVFLWMRDGKRREMGLGGYPDVSLLDARGKLEAVRRVVSEGGDPMAAVPKEETPKTFAEAAEDYVNSIAAGFRNDKHLAQWRVTTGKEYLGEMADKPVAAVTTEDVLHVLTAIWQKKPETATRIRGRIERVIDYAIVKKWRHDKENPARWRGHLKNALPSPKKLVRGHHPAMPYDEVPAFMAKLRTMPSVSARALEFLILCASRSGEVRGAVVGEFDFKANIWTIPKERMKPGREHRVPLSGRAAAIAKALIEEATTPFLFLSSNMETPLSDMALTMVLRRQQLKFTAHGFRSSFRDWAGDETSYPRELAEVALSHAVGDATEQAYRRSDALERRRKLMQAWADFCAGQSNVIQMVK